MGLIICGNGDVIKASKRQIKFTMLFATTLSWFGCFVIDTMDFVNFILINCHPNDETGLY